MARIVDKKINYIPFRIIGLSATICFDYEPLLKDGVDTDFASWRMHTFVIIPSMKELKEFILEEINKDVDKAILTGFKWKDIPIWLSAENQFNYKAAYDLAVQTNGVNLPITFKFGTANEPIYYRFETMEELQDFYIKAITYINEQLIIGWNKKDSVDWSVYEKFFRF